MCGIAGVISPIPLTDGESGVVDRMNQCLVHRGPDSGGRFCVDRVAMGMRRLSIIDLEGGQQPIFNETGEVAIVCNGEIYNYVELRDELLRRGHRFSSGSDVETIVHLYEEKSLEFLSGLRGMFALALWDGTRQRLILARDRMGEKPLYWYRDPRGRVWFASEMKSLLLALDREAAVPSPDAVNLFLTYQYVPEPRTMFEAVRKLPAGHLFEISTSNPRDATPRRYWDYLAPRCSTGDAVEQVRTELERACKIMGRADVPVGIALSGGIDSSVVAALSVRTYPGTLQAFTVGYPGRPENDERLAASSLARHLDIPFFEVELKEEDFIRGLPQLIWSMDDPIADIAAYGYYAVAALARGQGVPVLLSGLGGDELFWGYSWVRDAVRRTEQKRVRNSLSRWFHESVGGRGTGGSEYMVLFDLHEDLRRGDLWSRAILTPSAAERLPANLWMNYIETSEWDRVPIRLSNILNQTWLVSNCLALADRTTMAHSIEMRLPLLDGPLIELVTGFRQNGLNDWQKPHKWLLIEAVKGILPEEIFWRQKQGFTPPVRQWMEAVGKRYGFMVTDGTLVRRGILNKSAVARFLATGPDTFFAYKLVLLEIWCRMFVDRLGVGDIIDLSAEGRERRARGVSA
jgi:asparagine synthase (glutamine-hydrolysing)